MAQSYVLDNTPQTVKIESGRTKTLEFLNTPMGSLLIVKKDAATGQPIPGVEFFVTTSDGSVLGDANGRFVTGPAGTILVSNITPGTTVVARETRAAGGYLLDNAAQSIVVESGRMGTLEFLNQPLGSIVIVKKDDYNIGTYGRRHKQYLEENHHGLYSRLTISGKLWEYLAEIDRTCNERMDRLIPAMAKREGVTEALKASNQLEWAGRMNSIHNSAEEIVLSELVYTT